MSILRWNATFSLTRNLGRYYLWCPRCLISCTSACMTTTVHHYLRRATNVSYLKIAPQTFRQRNPSRTRHPELYETLRCQTPSSGSSSSVSSVASSASYKSNVTSGSKKSETLRKAVKEVAPGKCKKAHRPAPEEMHFENASAHRSYFSSATHRQNVVFGPSDIITPDLCYGFIEFSPSLSLRLPGGVSFDLMRYWDGLLREEGSGSPG